MFYNIFEYGNKSYRIFKINIFKYEVTSFEILFYFIFYKYKCILLKFSKLSTIFLILKKFDLKTISVYISINYILLF